MIWHLLIGGFLWLLGLCVGSFLNVVIHRLPLGLSLHQPRWSFCPACRCPIAWFDNIPLLGWLWLRGRCRSCRAPISVQYPLVEALTGLAFVLVYHLLAVHPAHVAVADFRWPADVPLLAAWLVLTAALIVCTSTDIVSYSIDIRVTDAALYAGVVLLALWPGAADEARWLSSPLVAGVVAAGVVAALLLYLNSRQEAAAQAGVTADSGAADASMSGATPSAPAETENPLVDPLDQAQASGTAQTGPAQTAPAQTGPVPSEPTQTEPTQTEPYAAGWVSQPETEAAAITAAAACDVGEVAGSGAATGSGPFAADGHLPARNVPAMGAMLLVATVAAVLLLVPGVPGVVPAVLALGFAVIVLAGGLPRAADQEIVDAIEDEQPRARRVALGELGWLFLPVAAGTMVYLLLRGWPPAAAGWQMVMEWSPGGSLQPVAGAALAVFGAVIGAGAGWLLRIGFTLALGREAFGTGDIYILAAAGAAAGWSIALLGLLLAVVIALLGWLVGLVLKSSGMIPFGPWLMLGFLSALALQRPAGVVFEAYREHLGFAWEQRPDMLLVGGGVLLVGGALALIIARLMRRALERG